MIKVLVIEDDRIIGRDICELTLEIGTNVKLVSSSSDAKRQFLDYQPDLILCDINLSEELTGVDLIKDFRRSNHSFEVIYVTAHSDHKTMNEVTQTEPINFLVKPFSKEQFQITVGLAIDQISASVVNVVDPLINLTGHEQQIVKLISKGNTSKEIADQLYVSVKTIRNHRYNIGKKLSLSNEKNSLLTWCLMNVPK